jgi:hypothetical protein
MSAEPASSLLRAGAALALAALALAALGACGARDVRTRVDGGLYVPGDSGLSFDARTLWVGDAEPVDSGPYQCPSSCAEGEVCACLDTSPRPTCGCATPQRHMEPCDPQVPASCRSPLACVRARRLDGTRYLCSDGREGSSCTPSDSVCRTTNGCVCYSTPIGAACSCRGEIGENPELCDPNVPATCPDGMCVRLATGVNPTFFCSQGARFDPCDPAAPFCVTSLGCLCPVLNDRPACQCTEPGAVGEPCDLAVPESCRAGLSCVLVSAGLDSFDSRCADRGLIGSDAGVLEGCSEARPCPPPLECVEVRPGLRRCTPRT